MAVRRRRAALRDMHVDVHSASAGHGVGGAGWGRPGAERVREVRWALASLLEQRLRASKRCHGFESHSYHVRKPPPEPTTA